MTFDKLKAIHNLQDYKELLNQKSTPEHVSVKEVKISGGRHFSVDGGENISYKHLVRKALELSYSQEKQGLSSDDRTTIREIYTSLKLLDNQAKQKLKQAKKTCGVIRRIAITVFTSLRRFFGNIFPSLWREGFNKKDEMRKLKLLAGKKMPDEKPPIKKPEGGPTPSNSSDTSSTSSSDQRKDPTEKDPFLELEQLLLPDTQPKKDPENNKTQTTTETKSSDAGDPVSKPSDAQEKSSAEANSSETETPSSSQTKDPEPAQPTLFENVKNRVKQAAAVLWQSETPRASEVKLEPSPETEDSEAAQPSLWKGLKNRAQQWLTSTPSEPVAAASPEAQSAPAAETKDPEPAQPSRVEGWKNLMPQWLTSTPSEPVASPEAQSASAANQELDQIFQESFTCENQEEIQDKATWFKKYVTQYSRDKFENDIEHLRFKDNVLKHLAALNAKREKIDLSHKSNELLRCIADMLGQNEVDLEQIKSVTQVVEAGAAEKAPATSFDELIDACFVMTRDDRMKLKELTRAQKSQRFHSLEVLRDALLQDKAPKLTVENISLERLAHLITQENFQPAHFIQTLQAESKPASDLLTQIQQGFRSCFQNETEEKTQQAADAFMNYISNYSQVKHESANKQNRFQQNILKNLSILSQRNEKVDLSRIASPELLRFIADTLGQDEFQPDHILIAVQATPQKLSNVQLLNACFDLDRTGRQKFYALISAQKQRCQENLEKFKDYLIDNDLLDQNNPQKLKLKNMTIEELANHLTQANFQPKSLFLKLIHNPAAGVGPFPSEVEELEISPAVKNTPIQTPSLTQRFVTGVRKWLPGKKS